MKFSFPEEINRGTDNAGEGTATKRKMLSSTKEKHIVPFVIMPESVKTYRYMTYMAWSSKDYL